MRIDFSKQLHDLDGEALTFNNKPATLKIIAVNSLLGTFPDEQNLSGEDKLARFMLAKKVNENDPNTDYSVEEISLIKKLMGKGFPPLVIGATFPILDQKENAE